MYFSEKAVFNTCSLIDQHARIPGDGSETCPQFPTDIAIKRPDLFKRIDASFVRMYKGLHSLFEHIQHQIFISWFQPTGLHNQDEQVRLLLTSSTFGAMNITAGVSVFGRKTLKTMFHSSFELIATVPADACNHLKVKYRKTNSTGYAAFTTRGDCSFEDKIQRAQKSGAKVVLIGDTEYEGFLQMARVKMVCFPFPPSPLNELFCLNSEFEQTEEEAEKSVPALLIRKVDALHIHTWLAHGSVHLMLCNKN